MRDELVPSDLEPLFRRGNARRADRIDAQADGRAPRHRVLDELHSCAVVGEEKWAGPLQALDGLHVLVRLRIEFGAGNAVRPQRPNDVRACLLSETEVNPRSGDQPSLQQQPGADLDRAADTERVDALVAEHFRGARPDDLPVIALCTAIERLLRLTIPR